MEISKELIEWIENQEEGVPIEWSEFCEQADIPYTEIGSSEHTYYVKQRNQMRNSLNKITRNYVDEPDRDGMPPFELLSLRVLDEEWVPDDKKGETGKDRPSIRVLMKLGGDGRLDARMHHHIMRNKNAPRNMLREMKVIAKDKSLTKEAKGLADRLVKAAHIQTHYIGKYLQKTMDLKRLSDATAQRCLADALVVADEDDKEK
jgi:hypothetical protein